MNVKTNNLETQIKYLGLSAKQYFKDIPLQITGLHYCIGKRPKIKGIDINICFGAATHNPYFFGETYDNARRIGLKILISSVLKDKIAELFPPECAVSLDVYVNLKRPHVFGNPFQAPALSENAEKSARSGLTLLDFQKLVDSGEIEKGSVIDYYCTKYGLDHILKQAAATISPDSVSVEALETIHSLYSIKSVLEIGGGVGICGKAAESLGISDYTVVDASPMICNYLKERLTGRVVNENAFNFKFNRKWDLILLGLNYELNPWFLSQRGSDLASHCSMVVIQSGIGALFEFEHNWVNGQREFYEWPWFEKKQTLQHYFPEVFQGAIDLQLCAIGTRQKETALNIKKSMETHCGLTNIKYNYLT